MCTNLHRTHPAESATPCLQISPGNLKLPVELWQSGRALSHDIDSMTACPHVKEFMNSLTHAVAFYGKKESSCIPYACHARTHTHQQAICSGHIIVLLPAERLCEARTATDVADWLCYQPKKGRGREEKGKILEIAMELHGYIICQHMRDSLILKLSPQKCLGAGLLAPDRGTVL